MGLKYKVTTPPPGAYRQNLGFFGPGSICELPEEDEMEFDKHRNPVLDAKGRHKVFVSSIPSVHWEAVEPHEGYPERFCLAAKKKLHEARVALLEQAESRKAPPVMDTAAQVRALLEKEAKAEKPLEPPAVPPGATVSFADPPKGKSGRAADKQI
jgi:hypothetical protein